MASEEKLRVQLDGMPTKNLRSDLGRILENHKPSSIKGKLAKRVAMMEEILEERDQKKRESAEIAKRLEEGTDIAFILTVEEINQIDGDILWAHKSQKDSRRITCVVERDEAFVIRTQYLSNDFSEEPGLKSLEANIEIAKWLADDSNVSTEH